jgi:hypothetical protein
MPEGGRRTATNGPWKYWTNRKLAENTVDETETSDASQTGRRFASKSMTWKPCEKNCA